MVRVETRAGGLEWIGLTEATVLLGVSASTLRRWADEGAIRTFITPGGHRRFWRPAVESLVPGAAHPHPAVEVLGESARTRMSRIYRTEVRRETPADVPWALDLPADERAMFRDHGRRIVADMLEALDASQEPARRAALDAAEGSASAYGRASARIGLAASITAETFLRFRRPFMAELSALARRRGLDAAATTDLLDRARDAFDRLLVAMLSTYESAATPKPSSPSAPRPPARSQTTHVARRGPGHPRRRPVVGPRTRTP